jgi:hypothetical protein
MRWNQNRSTDQQNRRYSEFAAKHPSSRFNDLPCRSFGPSSAHRRPGGLRGRGFKSGERYRLTPPSLPCSIGSAGQHRELA